MIDRTLGRSRRLAYADINSRAGRIVEFVPTQLSSSDSEPNLKETQPSCGTARGAYFLAEKIRRVEM
jgi:hypothetical protein